MMLSNLKPLVKTSELSRLLNLKHLVAAKRLLDERNSGSVRCEDILGWPRWLGCPLIHFLA